MNTVVFFKHNKPYFRSKIAAFDLDHTLIKPIGAKTFSQDENDFIFYNPLVPSIIQNYYDKGFMIMIITNQSKNYKYKLIENFLKLIPTPLIVIIGNKEIRKPQQKLFNYLFQIFPTKNISNINFEKSFFIGDAAGNLGDFSDSDKEFAHNIGFKFIPTNDFMRKDYQPSKNRELIIMVGFPASGKSTYAKLILNNHPDQYEIVSGDEFKTEKKIIKKINEIIKNNNKNIIVDSTNVSKKKREPLIQLAKENGLKPVIIFSQTTMDNAMAFNDLRNKDQKVPKIAYYKLRKSWEEPDLEEGVVINYIGL